MTEQTPQPAKIKFRKYFTALEPFIDKPKNRVYTAAVFSFLAISLFGWYAIRPTVKTILFLQKEIAEKTEINKKMENKIADLIEAQIKYQEIQNDLVQIEEAIPKSPESIDLALQLRNLVATTNASISAYSLGSELPLVNTPDQIKKPAINKDNHNNVPVSLTVNGEYPTLEETLNKFNQLKRIVTVNSVSLAPSKKSTSLLGENLLQLVMQIQSYYKQ